MSVSTGKWLALGLALALTGARAETVSLRLRDGSVVRGEVLMRKNSTVTIRNVVLGEVTVRSETC